MFENPGDELYFGEVYRNILQEPWLPGGADVWEVIGKSRRGRRPSQMGIIGPNVSPSQEEVRRWFSKCAAAWRALPWELPPSPFCDNRNDRKYWKDQKDIRGLMCSYYDLYMRYCLRFALDTDCIPPANYLLKVEPVLTDIGCNKVYDLMFPNKCGEVSMVSGDGEFVAPSEWVSPKCGTEGNLCFKDENGSYGFTSFSFAPGYRCEDFIWPVINPLDIIPGTSKPVYVEGGVPPYTWVVTGAGFSFANPITRDPFNSLQASSDACGTALIHVIDICGNEITARVLCTAGSWIHISTNSSNYYGCSPWESVWGGESYDIVEGYQKWEMTGAPTLTSKCCPGDTVDCRWDQPDIPPPPCGNPCECDGVIGRCGDDTVTLWPHYRYYEWGC